MAVHSVISASHGKASHSTLQSYNISQHFALHPKPAYKSTCNKQGQINASSTSQQSTRLCTTKQVWFLSPGFMCKHHWHHKSSGNIITNRCNRNITTIQGNEHHHEQQQCVQLMQNSYKINHHQAYISSVIQTMAMEIPNNSDAQAVQVKPPNSTTIHITTIQHTYNKWVLLLCKIMTNNAK